MKNIEIIKMVTPLNYGKLVENIKMFKETLKEEDYFNPIQFKEDGKYDLTNYKYGKYTICTFEFFNKEERFVYITNARMSGHQRYLLKLIHRAFINETYETFKSTLREGEELPTMVQNMLRFTDYSYTKDGRKSYDIKESYYNLYNAFYVTENYEKPILAETELGLIGEVGKQEHQTYNSHKVNCNEPYLFVRCKVNNTENYYRYIKYLQNESEYDDIKEKIVEYVREDYLSDSDSEEEIECVDINIELCRGEIVEMFGGMVFGLDINVLDSYNGNVERF